ncbi:GNAT family N-acetyltransferase [Micromonospora sp. NBC_01699]|uniref:GNAT family N-acetyltransferase n=1 Tax=Micromonospora sp. NBC_01699 TaxID=2975984 RepID=UPI002E2FD79F|nr:GNAT family N-acetyltransferase [Micromonospora sp. NBC_01699]
MKYDWPTELSLKDMREMIGLMNEVALKEMTLGFTEPLNDEDGLALMRAFDADLRRGALELLAVRTDDGEIVGMLTLARAPLPARRHVVDLRRCVIKPSHRGQLLLEGFGQAVRRMAEMGCDVITLEVRDDGPKQLWHRLGFQEYGRLPDYARKNGEPVTGHFMYASRVELEEHFRLTGSWLHTPESVPA